MQLAPTRPLGWHLHGLPQVTEQQPGVSMRCCALFPYFAQFVLERYMDDIKAYRWATLPLLGRHRQGTQAGSQPAKFARPMWPSTAKCGPFSALGLPMLTCMVFCPPECEQAISSMFYRYRATLAPPVQGRHQDC